jgi:hypothetical protein
VSENCAEGVAIAAVIIGSRCPGPEIQR